MDAIKEEKKLIKGLTEKQVQDRIKKGEINKEVKAPSKSVGEIIASNVFTYFNLIFVLLALILFLVESYRDLTFMPIIIANTVIGIVQELRSKKVLDKLTMLNAPIATVIRDGVEYEIPASELVKDDIVVFKSGDQICADAEVIDGEVSVNEALLTGEADEIHKIKGAGLMSGSFVVSGNCYAKLTKVGEKSYISKLTLEAKKVKNGEQSEMIRSLNKLVKIAGILIIPIGAILFSQQYFLNGLPIKESVQSMVAAIIGMIPEGLFLLASVTLAISAVKLAQKKVLLHDMKSIETLARVNVLCVDKTGTITDDRMHVTDVVKLETYNGNKEELISTIGDFVKAQKADNITMETLKYYFTKDLGLKKVSVIGFSSQYKYSGVEFENESYILGAPEFVLRDKYEIHKNEIEKYSKLGNRVLLFGKYEGKLDGKELTSEVIPYALIIINNPIRENAVETFRYFEEQGVAIKVISGDNPITVSEIAKKAKIKNADKYIDATKLKTTKDIASAVTKYTVFGRVTPEQKRKLIQQLKKKGNTVAMTGDGVNDVLALKDADCSVAMASGSQAAVQASQLVLLESDFSKMPDVVKEGRRVVNNLQCSGSLFLVKNIFSVITAILAICFSMQYPLKPSQISLISLFTIGMPAFLLSQSPNKELIKGRFISNILANAIPGGLTDTLMVEIMVLCGNLFGIQQHEIATASTILLAVVGIMVVMSVSKPISVYKVIVWILCIVGLILSMTFLQGLFELTELSEQAIVLCVLFSILTGLFLQIVKQICKFIAKKSDKFFEKKLLKVIE